MIRLVFFTSNITKLAHARHVAESFEIEIIGFRQHTYRADYKEPRHVSRQEMFEQSYRSALVQFEKSGIDPKKNFFFLEDTSVRIEALSDDRDDYPGLDIKFWMKEVDFAMVDRQLRLLGNDRRARVRSDVLLHIPAEYAARLGVSHPYHIFVGTQDGTIVEEEEDFKENLVFPWLNNRTFNKWFQPIGEVRPLGALDIERADAVDFRRGSLGAMFSFMHSNVSHEPKSKQYEMNLEQNQNLILCGYTCAGKTTASQMLARRFGYLHVEASDFMYLSFFQRHGYGTDITIGEFAEQALAQRPTIAAEKIVEYLQESLALPIVISGFRSALEIEEILERLSYSGKQFGVIFVDATERERFTRLANRGRPGDRISFEEFLARDEQQRRMGLTGIRSRADCEVWENSGSLEWWKEYVAEKVAVINPTPLEVEYAIVRAAERGVVKLEEAILVTLLSKWNDDERTRPYFTTTEIMNSLNNLFANIVPKHKDNVSRYFNQHFHAYYEVDQSGENEPRGFRLSNTGYGRALQTLRGMMLLQGDAAVG